MLWTDNAIVLSARPFGEGRAIASLFTAEHGSHRGVVPGGNSRTRRHLLQPGTLLLATWRARVAEQLGVLTVELLRGLDTRVIHDRLRLAALVAACSLLDASLPEREPNPELYLHTLALLDGLTTVDRCVEAYAAWERRLVAALGFGLTPAAPPATQLRHTLQALEEHVFASGRAGMPAARHRLASLIDGDRSRDR